MTNRKLSAAALAGMLVLGMGGGAVAVGGAPAVQPGQSLAQYMNDDKDAEWDKVQTWLEANGIEPQPAPTEEPTPEPEPTTDPTQEPAPEPTPTEEPPAEETSALSADVQWTETGVTYNGKIAGANPGDRVQIRTDTKELTGQRGFYEYEFVKTDGTVQFTLADYSTPQAELHWHVAIGGSEFDYGNVVETGVATQPAGEEPAPEPAPTEEPAPSEPATGDTTGGSGGALTDRLEQSFSSAGLTSDYHIFAEGIDTSKPVGILMYGDGSGGYGIDYPSSSYLIGGSNGLAAVAQKHNLILVTPEAPAPGCDGTDNCWYDGTHAAKAKWSSDLMTKIKGQYDIDNSRVVIGGYSSGAQWTTQSFLPTYGEAQSVDLAVAIAYGGAPRSSMQASADWKNDLVVSFDTGTADEAYTSASYGALGGYNWYTDAGFSTDATWPSGVGHGRSGEFGGIVDREITQHLG